MAARQETAACGDIKGLREKAPGGMLCPLLKHTAPSKKSAEGMA